MQIARVVGLVVSTAKQGGFHGRTLLLLEKTGPDGVTAPAQAGPPGASTYVATDYVGAGVGVGDVVLVTTGSAARTEDGTATVPTDAAVVAIVDTVVVGSTTLYSTNG